jgi:hypothetical protein
VGFSFVLRFPPARPCTDGAGKVEYIPYHICGSRTVLPRISHDPAHCSHRLLPFDPGE